MVTFAITLKTDSMERMKIKLAMLLLAAVSASCEIVDDDMKSHVDNPKDSAELALSDVAMMLASVPIQDLHLLEVHMAVTESAENGYDEEYTMKNLFLCPGSGLGGTLTKTESITNPLRDLLAAALSDVTMTKGHLSDRDMEAKIRILANSDIQIYWPYSESWDGQTAPIITFDPEDESSTNVGYERVVNADGSQCVKEIEVDEEMALSRPVWVINRNTDSRYQTAEILTKTTAKNEVIGRSLVLKEIKAERNYDSWFAGASEFWIKVGAVEDFTAVTEAEMYLYNPSVTDFMVVVKRGQVGKPLTLNSLLVSNWTDQMVNCAFMITEDDGGTRTNWECTALVRVESKSYGIEMKLPLNSRDDIVWRGQLASKWLEAHNGKANHFGDVDVTFEVLEY